MPRRGSSRARLAAKLTAAVAATALFGFSLTGLAGLDGRLATAVSEERDAIPVMYESPGERWERDCPRDAIPEREPHPRGAERYPS